MTFAKTREAEDARWAVERTEKWRDLVEKMPFIRFPADWEVAVIPPFSGAIARFRVRRGVATVSVYADFYERLGIWAEPHWEIYPSETDDNERFAIATETDEMIAAIERSLIAQASAGETGTAETNADSVQPEG